MTGIEQVTRALIAAIGGKLAGAGIHAAVTPQLLPDEPGPWVSVYLYSVEWPAAGGDRGRDGTRVRLRYVVTAQSDEAEVDQALLDRAMLALLSQKVMQLGEHAAAGRVEVVNDDVTVEFESDFWATTGHPYRPAAWYRCDLSRPVER